MDWIEFYQTPFDRIRYITNEMDEPESMSYKEFLYFLFHSKKLDPINRKALLEHIDCFDTVLLFSQSGEWKIVETDKRNNHSFTTLYQLQQMIKSNEQLKNQTKTTKVKQFVLSRWGQVKDSFKFKNDNNH